ncbi:hypothetical protein PGTUg99_009614 [Puccinia graminis f. sp. tritici]|uniref:Uncharacterized protein n=1 Tax=Puccinia graminis f. sp. tritici TaxID=56615 RepID=A0A5B0RC74_PUCGR|nr:hypothetical protein PGTUg99_009614 [Puccinia graminis f. sp. tritici]
MPVLACQQPMMRLTIVRHAPRGAASRIYQATNRSFMTSTASRSAQQLAGYNGSTPLYHHQPSGQLSFLDTPPVFPGSPTVIGTLSAQGRFQGNPSFVDLLHSVFCGVYLDDPYVRDLALSRKSASADSYLHVLGQFSHNRSRLLRVLFAQSPIMIFKYTEINIETYRYSDEESTHKRSRPRIDHLLFPGTIHHRVTCPKHLRAQSSTQNLHSLGRLPRLSCFPPPGPFERLQSGPND